ncbi:MAG TPA: deoxyribonuclease V [Dehalococcoidia bacterium]
MLVRHIHAWDLSPREAISLQSELASRIVREGDLPASRVRFVAGSDVAFDRPSGRAVGAVVLLAYPSLECVERVTVETSVTFPYVPGLLSFRETPVLIQAFEQLREMPDLLMVDGHGYAHPRRFGFASHLGLLLDLPTIGVAKSRLLGTHESPAMARGSRVDLRDRDETIGAVVRTRERVRPIYVSVGHRISLEVAERWVLACAPNVRLPEPTRIADRLAGEAKRRMLDATLDIVIEQRAGEPGRWEWVPEDDEIVFRHDMPPMPVHYGAVPGIVNPADGELLDVMVANDGPRESAERMSVRVVDVLERRDGDDKLLAVPLDGPLTVPDSVRQRIWKWCTDLEKPVVQWGGEERALALIRACREPSP